MKIKEVNVVDYNNFLNKVSSQLCFLKGIINKKAGDIDFVPEKGHFEALKVHHFRAISYYNMIKKESHIGIFDGGYFGFSDLYDVYGLDGYEIIVPGKVDLEQVVAKRTFNKLLTFLYNEEEKKIRKIATTSL